MVGNSVQFLRISADLNSKDAMLSFIQQGSKKKQEKVRMNRIVKTGLLFWKDTQGQDLIEYALMAGFVAVAAGAVMPSVSTSISTIFSKISSSMSSAAATGS
jgi:pilus assembly protein Flp/PilA